MSRLFRSRLKIGLAPDRLLLSSERRGLRKARAESAEVPVASGREHADWRPAVEALPAALAASGLDRPEVSVVLSNHFVRYALLPPNDALKKDAEWRAFARHRLATIHGAVSDDWLVRVSAAQPEGVRIVTAADNALIEEVRARVAEAGGTLVSAQPNLVAAFNRVRDQVDDVSCWLVIRETGRLTMALLEGGTWHALRTRRVDDDAEVPLQEILERECALLALPEPCTRTVMYVHENFAVLGGEAQRLEDWSAGSVSAHGSLRSKAPLEPVAHR